MQHNDIASPRREPGNKLGTDALLSKGHALVGDNRRPTEGAVEIEVVQPTIEAASVKHMAARKASNLVSVFEGALAHHTLGRTNHAGRTLIAATYNGVSVGDALIKIELLGEDDQAGKARSDGCEKSIVDYGRVRVESGES